MPRDHSYQREINRKRAGPVSLATLSDQLERVSRLTSGRGTVKGFILLRERVFIWARTQSLQTNMWWEVRVTVYMSGET